MDTQEDDMQVMDTQQDNEENINSATKISNIDCKSKMKCDIQDIQDTKSVEKTFNDDCSSKKEYDIRENSKLEEEVDSGAKEDVTNSIQKLQNNSSALEDQSFYIAESHASKEQSVDHDNVLLDTKSNCSSTSSANDMSKPAKKQNLVLPKENLSLPEACKSGDVELVQNLLSKSTDMINVPVDGWTCLHDVSMRECQFSEIAEVLLEHGANVNVQDDSGNTPLHIAIIYHCIENVKILLKYNADVHKKNKQRASSIDAAFNIKDNEILELLGQKPVQERKHKRKVVRHIQESSTRIDLQTVDLTFCSPPILKKRKLNDSDKSLPRAKRRCVKFSDLKVD